MRLHDLSDGQVAYCQGRFFFQRGGQLTNEFGVLTYPKDWDAPCVLTQPRRVRACVDYRCTSRWQEHPHLPIVFQDADGYRYRVRLHDWKLELAFEFETRDPRSPIGVTRFTASSGRFAKALVTASSFRLQIDEAGLISCLLDDHKLVLSGQ